jgi:hypothetical protein
MLLKNPQWDALVVMDVLLLVLPLVNVIAEEDVMLYVRIHVTMTALVAVKGPAMADVREIADINRITPSLIQ